MFARRDVDVCQCPLSGCMQVRTQHCSPCCVPAVRFVVTSFSRLSNVSHPLHHWLTPNPFSSPRRARGLRCRIHPSSDTHASQLFIAKWTNTAKPLRLPLFELQGMCATHTSTLSTSQVIFFSRRKPDAYSGVKPVCFPTQRCRLYQHTTGARRQQSIDVFKPNVSQPAARHA